MQTKVSIAPSGWDFGLPSKVGCCSLTIRRVESIVDGKRDRKIEHRAIGDYIDCVTKQTIAERSA
jgi:hypothetical protein